MLKKTMTYRDYNGLARTEDFYFNLTKAEVFDMEIGVAGGMAEWIDKLIATKDVPAIAAIFKDMILKAYGEKSLDGKRFIKIDANGHRLADDFAQTEAYSDLYMELALDSTKASEFVNGIMPEFTEEDFKRMELQAQYKNAIAEAGAPKN